MVTSRASLFLCCCELLAELAAVILCRYDNHYGIDGARADLTLNQYKRNLDARGWPYYHGWHGQVGPENVYVVDPTGDAIQLDSQWLPGTAPPGLADDALGNMCTQGNCVAAMRPTPPACVAKLVAVCPALQEAGEACSGCVYAPSTFAALKGAGCLNADLVGFCIGT